MSRMPSRSSSPARRGKEPAPPPRRRRRDAATVRAAILDVAERHLVGTGPAGIRLQDVAAEAGVSHPNVLHHFGSREALVAAVIARALDDMHARILAAIEASTGREDQLVALFEHVYEALTRGGCGRIVLWLALGGYNVDAGAVSLADVVEAAQALRKAKTRGKERAPAREDTAHVVVLATLALTGSSVLFPALLKNVGLGHDEAAGARFRAWLAQLLMRHVGFAR
jgi:AcrR family transcriptional regulator